MKTTTTNGTTTTTTTTTRVLIDPTAKRYEDLRVFIAADKRIVKRINARGPEYFAALSTNDKCRYYEALDGSYTARKELESLAKRLGIKCGQSAEALVHRIVSI